MNNVVYVASPLFHETTGGDELSRTALVIVTERGEEGVARILAVM